ncbi:MAG: EamA family transporter [Micrococcales bacterium]|nr:EamA family transporter [Micrococcales bacterium]
MNAQRQAVTPSAVSMVLIAGITANLGSVVAVKAFELDLVGPAGIVGLRSGFSALVLLAVTRPAVRGHSRPEWRAVLGFGVAIAVMNGFFNEAIALIPVGPAVTIEMLGPLVLSVILARRATGWLWAGLALVGVVMIRGVGEAGGAWHPLGVFFAACAAVAWACYILLTRKTGTMFKSVEALAWAQLIATILTLPRAFVVEGVSTMCDWRVLGFGLAVALLSNTICNGLELIALRRMPAHVFSVMMALGPVFGSLLAWILIGQRLGLLPWLGIALVVLSSMGATLGDRRSKAHATAGEPDLI